MCCTLLFPEIYLMHKHRASSAGQKDDGNHKKKDEHLSFLCAGCGNDVCSSLPRECPVVPGVPGGTWSWCCGTSLCQAATITFPLPCTLCSTHSHLCWMRSSCRISTVLNPTTFYIIHTGGSNWTYSGSRKIARNCCVPGDTKFLNIIAWIQFSLSVSDVSFFS